MSIEFPRVEYPPGRRSILQWEEVERTKIARISSILSLRVGIGSLSIYEDDHGIQFMTVLLSWVHCNLYE